MKKRMKKYLAVLLAFALSVTAVPNGLVTIFASENQKTESDIKDEDKTEINNGINLKSKGVKVNLFDYNIKDGAKWEYYNYYSFRCVVNDVTRAWAEENGVKETELFLFGGNRQYSSSVYGAQNAWTGEKGGVYQGIVSKQLNDGKLEFSGNTGEGNVYGVDLFPSQQEVSGLKYVKGYYDVDFLFNVDQDGYYNFNSDKYMASNLKLAEDGIYNLDFDFNQVGPVFSSVTGTDKRNCGFFPFNSYTEVSSNEDSETKKVYQANKERHHLFGMELGFDFFMPKEGIYNNKQMVFKFTGDDDVWIYIDGKLALDLGGIHDATGGEINFATGEITYYNVYNKTTGKSQEKTVSLEETIGFDRTAYKKHSLKMFYLERGESDSNCSLNFNMPVFPEGEDISIHKEVTGLNNSIAADKSYDFVVLYGDDKKAVETSNVENLGNNVKKYNGNYEIYNSGIEGEKKETKDGIISIKADETATLSIPRGNYYKIIEVSTGDYKTKWAIDCDSKKQLEKGNGIATSAIYSDDQKYFIVYTNEYQQETGNLVLRKLLEKDNTSQETFFFNIYLNGKKYNTEAINLKNGDAYIVNNLPYGTIFTIEEVLDEEQAKRYETPKVGIAASGSAVYVTGSGITVSGEGIVTEEKEGINTLFKFTGILQKNYEMIDVGLEGESNNNAFEVIIEYLNTVVPEVPPQPTETPEVSKKPTSTPEVSEGPTETPEVSESPTETPEVSESPTETPKASESPTETPKVSESPTETPKASESPTETPKASESPTETPKASESPTETPKVSESPMETPEASESPTETPKVSESPTETPKASESPTETPKVSESPTETPKASESPIETPVIIPTETPPGDVPEITPSPSQKPTENPTATPVSIPTQIPPAGVPSIVPTDVPVIVPTEKVPEGAPSIEPTEEPTVTISPDKVPDSLPKTGGLAGLAANTKAAGIGMFVLFAGCIIVIVYRRRSQK